MTDISKDARAALLLTCLFARERDARPLDTGEWNRILVRLRDRQARPGDLLSGRVSEILGLWDDPLCRDGRIQKLLDRDMALGLALERWQRAGLWIVARPEADYPGRLKERLRSRSAPILFGCGNGKLLDAGGIAVVGSRASGPEDEAFARVLGDRMARAGTSVISGNTPGVEQAALLSALDAGGTAIGVLGDSLFKESISRKYRHVLHNGNLVLVSPFPPEATFSIDGANECNRYIYCLADRAIAVHTVTTGRTWSGALENLKHRWVPLWVKRGPEANGGNEHLARRGAQELPEGVTGGDPQGFLDWLSADRTDRPDEPR